MLAFALSSLKANALTVENVSVSETGGVSVSGEASASGTDDASAEVWSIIQGTESNARVHVDVRTSTNGEEETTSVTKTLESPERVEVRIAPRARDETRSETGDSDDSAPSLVSGFAFAPERLLSVFSRVFDFVFFFLR